MYARMANISFGTYGKYTQFFYCPCSLLLRVSNLKRAQIGQERVSGLDSIQGRNPCTVQKTRMGGGASVHKNKNAESDSSGSVHRESSSSQKHSKSKSHRKRNKKSQQSHPQQSSMGKLERGIYSFYTIGDRHSIKIFSY